MAGGDRQTSRLGIQTRHLVPSRCRQTAPTRSPRSLGILYLECRKCARPTCESFLSLNGLRSNQYGCLSKSVAIVQPIRSCFIVPLVPTFSKIRIIFPKLRQIQPFTDLVAIKPSRSQTQSQSIPSLARFAFHFLIHPLNPLKSVPTIQSLPPLVNNFQTFSLNHHG